MRILHLVHRYAPHIGGSEEVVRQMSERLARRGYEVVVLTMGPPRLPEGGVEIQTVRGFWDYRQKLDRLTRDAEVLMVYGQKVWGSDWLPLAKIHCPVVYFPVGFDSWDRSLLHQLYYRTWQRSICRRADVLVALTRSEEKFLRSWLDHRNLVRIPNGVDYDHWQRPVQGRVEGIRRPFLFHAGGYYANKHVDALLTIAALLRERGSNVGLVTCGPDFRRYRERMQHLATELGLERYYKALGEVSASNLRRLYDGCSVYLSASTFEGFGLTFLESLACGKPLVCRPVGVAPELAEQTGSVIVAEELEDLVAGTQHFLQEGHDPEESRAVARRYDWERVVDKLEEVYLDLL